MIFKNRLDVEIKIRKLDGTFDPGVYFSELQPPSPEGGGGAGNDGGGKLKM